MAVTRASICRHVNTLSVREAAVQRLKEIDPGTEFDPTEFIDERSRYLLNPEWLLAYGEESQLVSDGKKEKGWSGSHDGWLIIICKDGRQPGFSRLLELIKWVVKNSLQIRVPIKLSGGLSRILPAAKSRQRDAFWLFLRPYRFRPTSTTTCDHCLHQTTKVIGPDSVFILYILGCQDRIIQVDWFVFSTEHAEQTEKAPVS